MTNDADDEDGNDDSALTGLDQLFVCKEYRPVSLQFGDSIVVDVLASPQASTDYDLTGQVLWPVSVLLAHYLVSQLHHRGPRRHPPLSSSNDAPPPLLQKVSVIELGAGGTAVPSFAAAQCYDVNRVLTTDGNDHVVFELLQRNVCRFNEQQQHQYFSEPAQQRVSAHPCLWGHRDHVRQLLQQLPPDAPVLVVAADVVQWPTVIEPLLHTVKALLWPRPSESQSTTPWGKMILGIVNRAQRTYQQFWSTAQRLGFRSTRLDDNDEIRARLFPDGTIPPECRESGGRQTELHELVLERFDDPPILLQDSTGDLLEESEHQCHNAVALPC